MRTKIYIIYKATSPLPLIWFLYSFYVLSGMSGWSAGFNAFGLFLFPFLASALLTLFGLALLFHAWRSNVPLKGIILATVMSSSVLLMTIARLIWFELSNFWL
jgi:hypothetical protein